MIVANVLLCVDFHPSLIEVLDSKSDSKSYIVEFGRYLVATYLLLFFFLSLFLALVSVCVNDKS